MIIDTLYAIGVMTAGLVLSAWIYTILRCGRDGHHPPHQQHTPSTTSMHYIDATLSIIALLWVMVCIIDFTTSPPH